MARKKNKEQSQENQSSTGGNEIIDTDAETPLAKPLGTGDQAFQLAASNKREIDKIRKEILKPSWLKDFVGSINSIINFIKIIVVIFLLLLIVFLIVFIVFSYVQLNYLIFVLETIRDNKAVEINQEILGAFNDFYYYAQKTIKIYVSFIISIGILALLATFVLQLSKYLIRQRKK